MERKKKKCRRPLTDGERDMVVAVILGLVWLVVIVVKKGII